jgi:hypothetical protein
MAQLPQVNSYTIKKMEYLFFRSQNLLAGYKLVVNFGTKLDIYLKINVTQKFDKGM